MHSIPAVFENGVFRPTVPVDLPEKTSVHVVVSADMLFDPLAPIRAMIAQGAAELDAGQTVSAQTVFADLATRRAQLQAEQTRPQ